MDNIELNITAAAQSGSYNFLSPIETRELVLQYLPLFVRACLDSEYDFFVPIESEGMALFVSQIQYPNRQYRILPSTTLDNIEPATLKGKKILVVDASVNSGQTLLDLATKIEQRFNCRTSFAAFIVRNDFEHKSGLVIKGYLELPSNQYIWAKETLIEYFLKSVFVRSDDPPMWEFNLLPEEVISLAHTLLRVPNLIVIPSAIDTIRRFTIDSVQATDNGWLPNGVYADGESKIRCLLDENNHQLRILPLFYPQVDVNTSLDITDILRSMDYVLAQNEKSVEKTLDVEKLYGLRFDSPFRIFRLYSVLGAVLLLRDFLTQIDNLGFSVDWRRINVSIQSQQIFSMTRESDLLEIVNHILAALESTEYSHSQLRLPHSLFRVRRETIKGYGECMAKFAEESLVSPEQALIEKLGLWMVQLEEEGLDTEKIIARGLTSSEIQARLGFADCQIASIAMDALIDEGILKPRTMEKDGLLSRRYSIASETARKRIRAYGLAVSAIIRREKHNITNTSGGLSENASNTIRNPRSNTERRNSTN